MLGCDANSWILMALGVFWSEVDIQLFSHFSLPSSNMYKLLLYYRYYFLSITCQNVLLFAVLFTP